jgi:hypothetical protein
MYALIQLRSQPTHRARIIAANNILNALFMIASSLIAGALLKAGFTHPADLPAHRPGQRGGGVLHLPAGARVPAALRGLGAVALVYRFKVRGRRAHPTVQGAAVLVCNHVSFVDAVLLMAASPRPIRFIMDHRIFGAGAGLAVPAGQGDPDRAAKAKTRRPTRRLRRGRAGAARGRPAGHLPRRRHHPRRRAAASSRAAS